MIVAVAAAILGFVGAVCTVVVTVRDSRPPIRDVWGYDTRRPLP